jgi:hypothetical protein
MWSEAIEPWKAADRAEERGRLAATLDRVEARIREERALARDAGLVFAVGPRLAASAATVLGIPVEVFLPGLPSELTGWPPVSGAPPPATRVLFQGRAEDLVLKGLDIAAAAMSRIRKKLPDGEALLVIRGLPREREDETRGRIESFLPPISARRRSSSCRRERRASGSRAWRRSRWGCPP